MMNDPRRPQPDADPLAFLAAGGEMGRLTREFDWSKTPLGPAIAWPQSLKTIVRTILDSRYAMWLGWGEDFTFFYNDAYATMTLGPKHPWALGKPARVVWSEIWPDIGPRAESVLRTGKATWDEGLLLFLERREFKEETYHTFSYSPVPDDRGGVGGLLCVVIEHTEQVIGERRLRTLRELAARTADEAKSLEDACQTTARLLAGNPKDVPFALLYLLDSKGRLATLAGATGVEPNQPASPAAVDLADPDAPWPLRAVAESGKAVVVRDLCARFGDLPGGAWPEPSHQAVVLPMAKPGQTQLAGFVIAGVSARRPLDDAYRGFLDLLAGQVATTVASARAHDDERQRARALAELDRTKTAFFSNVSHEFRTPLTLMLGPLEDALAGFDGALAPSFRERLEVVHRNGLRLQRLVNTLLDFARIEAGRIQATYQPTDLAAFTAELASNFRSACDRAGLELKVDCPALAEPVFVDRGMWEKVVLNLLSNAFKFTFDGGINVSLRQDGATAALEVRDTGVGIPAAQMPRLFERFHRVEDTRARTHEGSGIGLAIVHELVELHGGSISAQSEVGRGTAFTVTVPLGSAHLPPERLATSQSLAVATAGASPFVEEALRWLPEAQSGPEPGSEATSGREALSAPLQTLGQPASDRPRVLVADDNADMRQYIARLLAGKYSVEAVPDGKEALAAVRRRAPDLILSDVMMPRLDGFGLLHELRADPRTAALPVILLSARAGEESSVEGMQAGADDYLVKPFSAGELLARVSAHLQMARLRREASESLRASEERFQSFMDHCPTTAYIKDAQGRYVLVNRTLERQFDRPLAGWIGKTDLELFPPEEAERIRRNDLAVLSSRQSARFEEASTRPDGLHHYLSIKFPIQDRDGSWLLAGMAIDVTDRKRAEETQARLAAIIESSDDAIVSKTLEGVITSWNPGAERLFGYTAQEAVGKPINLIIPPERHDEEPPLLEQIRRGQRVDHLETVRVAKDGRRLDVSLTISPILDTQGRIIGASKIARDITARKRIEADLQERARLLREVAGAGLTVHSAGSLDSVLRVIAGEARRILGAHRGFASLTVADGGAKVTSAESTSGPGDRWDDASIPTPVHEARALVCRTNRPVRLSRAELDGRPAHHASSAISDRYSPIRGWMAAPLISRGGKNLGLISVSHRDEGDFSESDEAALAQLAHIASVAIENARLYGELREQDTRKDEFLALLAHELRNPLAPLRNGLQVMRLAGADAATVAQARGMMERQLGHMVRLVDDLLDISRISRNKMELRRSRVVLEDLVNSAVETARPAIEESEHKLTVSLPPQPVLLDADLTRLSQVFGNLLSNSAKYTPRGGHIWLSAEQSAAEVVVSVRDNGIGIPADSLRTIFDMFSQVSRSIEFSDGGLGIGLALVKGLVEMHGGTVTAESPGPGEGSTFTVRLPVLGVRANPVLESPSDEGRRASGRQRRILVVDDNRDSAASMAMMLKLKGNEVRTAHDGIEAVEVAHAFRPQVIMMDVGMPRLNGLEATRRIREQPWGRETTIIALTGWGQEGDKERSREAGCDGHLVKPVNIPELEKLLAEAQVAS
jgi:PAS domain S-box-containing protein